MNRFTESESQKLVLESVEEKLGEKLREKEDV